MFGQTLHFVQKTCCQIDYLPNLFGTYSNIINLLLTNVTNIILCIVCVGGGPTSHGKHLQ
jgi:hypothetical protein